MPAMAIALAACGFGAVSVLAKLAYDAGAAPDSLFASRVVVAGLLLSPLAIGGPRRAHGHRSRASAAAAGGSFAVAGLLEFEALSRLPASVLVPIVFMAPLWIALVSWTVLGERPARRSAALFPIVLLGMTLLVGAPAGSDLDPVGVALALGASFLFALVFLFLDDLLRLEAPGRAVARAMGWAVVPALAVEHRGVVSELGHAATAGYALAVGALTAASLLLLAAGLERTAAFPAALITGVEPLAAALLSLVLLGEAMTPLQVAGAFAIVTGVVGVSAGVADAR